MPLTINTNLNSLAAQLSAGRSQGDLTMSITRLSSGLRINTARDDAAGLAISQRFSSQIRGTSQAGRNANDAISTQTAEGALGSIGDGLQRMRELAVQSANATNSSSDRAALQQEVAQLVQEIDRVARQTQFNGIDLLDGSFAAQAFQVGANVDQTITVPQIASARPSALGQYRGVTFTDDIGIPNNTPTALAFWHASFTVGLGSVAVDAKAIAAAINNGKVSGLSATANATVVAAGSSAASGGAVSGSASFTINGVTIAIAGVSGSPALAGNRASAVSAINAQSTATGVVATDTGAGVSLSAADGRNITLAYAANTFTGSAVADFGIANTAITGATVNVTYIAPPGLTGDVFFGQAGGFTSTTTIGTNGASVAAIDVSSVAGANAALESIDRALTSVNSSRASFGAVQNRFGSTSRALALTGENLSAARSRVEDADFAMETANLARAQVLQQAGTAMIAQANQLPQQVLQLLR